MEAPADDSSSGAVAVLGPSPVAVSYPDGDTLQQLTHIVAKSVTALPDADAGGAPVDLTLGATGGVRVEAARGMDVYAPPDGPAIRVFSSAYDAATSARTDRQVLEVAATSGWTALQAAGSNALSLQGGDAQGTVRLADMTFRTANGMQVLSTTDTSNVLCASDAVFGSNLHVAGRATVAGDSYVAGNLVAQRNFFGANLNLVKPAAPNEQGVDQVGYALRINDRNQLEIVRCCTFPDLSTVLRRVAVFGAGALASNATPSDAHNYLVFDEYNGMAFAEGEHTPGGASGTYSKYMWRFNSNADVYIGAQKVGVNTADPQADLHVDGTVLADVAAASSFQTRSDCRVKDGFVPLDAAQCLSKVVALQPTSYVLKKDPAAARRTGLVAQQVQAVIGEAVTSFPDEGIADCLHIDNTTLIAHLIGSVQALELELRTLKQACG